MFLATMRAVWRKCDGGDMADVHPNGQPYFTTPHNGTALALHAFPGGGVLARKGAEGVLEACRFPPCMD
jgi:hypothetical protein